MVERQPEAQFEVSTSLNGDAPNLKRAKTGPRRPTLKQGALGLALLAGTALLGHAGYNYLTIGRYLESTDNAYVKADYTTVAPKVSGYISEVLVSDNQTVKAGDVLARIDDRDFRTALVAARANVASAQANVDNLDARLTLQQSIIAQSQANVTSSEANLKFAKVDYARYQHLMKTGFGAAQRAQQTEATLQEKSAQLLRDTAGVVAARKTVDVLLSEMAKATADLSHAEALAQQAELNLSYTNIIAPVDGTVGARALRVGAFVQAGTQLMAVVPLNAVYVVANFKETQLTHIRSGQPATISVDGYPDIELKGHVDSVSPASGLEFALLPPDNATGNFTKIVQRVPVKILIDQDSDASALTGLLRPGMSVEPTINTKAPTAARAAADTSASTEG